MIRAIKRICKESPKLKHQSSGKFQIFHTVWYYGMYYYKSDLYSIILIAWIDQDYIKWNILLFFCQYVNIKP